MSTEQTDKGLKLGAAVTKLEESIQDLDQAVESYGETLESYRDDQASREEVETAVDDLVQGFEDVFDDQNWVGEVTGDITDTEVENSYQKFIAYQGLVRAADELEEPERSQVNGPYTFSNRGSVKEQKEDILGTWSDFSELYEEAVELENTVEEISLEEGQEEQGLDPYAFETPFRVLEQDYQRVSDLNQCVNASYR